MELRDFTPRLYQQTVFSVAVNHNTLVVLPTGLGKTNILMMVAAYRLRMYPNAKIVVFAPTKPLLDQHLHTFQKHLPLEDKEYAVFTGLITPEKRQELWKQAKVIFSTPQGFQNDLLQGKIDISEVSLMAFDECHRAVGDYAYGFLAEQYVQRSRFPRVLGLTASPGSELEKIQEVCRNLHIERIELKTEQDPDVKQYIQDKDLTYITVELPAEYQTIKKHLDACIKQKMMMLKELGYSKTGELGSKKELLLLTAQIRADAMAKDFDAMKALSVIAEIMKAHHAQEMVESQGLAQAASYMDRLFDEAKDSKTKAVKNLVQDPDFKAARHLAGIHAAMPHPKLPRILEILSKELVEGKKAILFTNFRDTGQSLVAAVNALPNAKAALFVGQAKKADSGMSQKEQRRVLDEFRAGAYNVLCATSVAEEGLDIPNVDLVLFYEPVPSAIRSIQRRGRTGRQSEGAVIVMLTKGSREEAYRWSAHHKEKRMSRAIEELRKGLKLAGPARAGASTSAARSGQAPASPAAAPSPNRSLQDYAGEEAIILVDMREKHSRILRELMAKGIKPILKTLEVGDYVLSSECVAEFKTQEDFLQSIIDGRLLEQAKGLVQYPRPLIVVEGDQNIYGLRNMSAASITGMIASLLIDFKIPVVTTKNADETASLFAAIAKREQSKGNSAVLLHQKKGETLKDQQEYVVSALPGIGATLNKPLLQAFGSIKGVVCASEDELKKTAGIGPVRAKELRALFDAAYKE